MTLESYFYTFENTPDVFPGKHDLVSAYKTFKDFMDAEVHKEVKSMTMNKDGSIYLNDHSSDHVRMVMEKVSKILWDGDNVVVQLEPFECFVLLSAIQIHDAGHIVGGRVGHEKNSKVFLKKYDDSVVGTPEKKIIFQIALAHSGKDDPIGRLPQSEVVSDCHVRMRMLAALLRIGDEMADEASRASKFLFDENQITEGSRLFHAFSLSLNSFLPYVMSQDVRMKFNLNKNLCNEVFKKPTKGGGTVDTYLLDEIYERTFKTFHECIYYNRFVPYNIRLNTVSVQIEFYDEEDFEPFFKTIKYRLEEKGYPHLQEDIYDLCGIDLEHEGNKLNGEYLKNKIGIDGNEQQ